MQDAERLLVKAKNKRRDGVGDPTCVTPDFSFFRVDGSKKPELWNGIQDELLLIRQMLLPEQVQVLHPK